MLRSAQYVWALLRSGTQVAYVIGAVHDCSSDECTIPVFKSEVVVVNVYPMLAAGAAAAGVIASVVAILLYRHHSPEVVYVRENDDRRSKSLNLPASPYLEDLRIRSASTT